MTSSLLDSFDLADPAFLADPYPSYEEMRALGPVWLRAEDRMAFVSHHAAVSAVLKAPDPFSSRVMILPGVEAEGAGSLIGQDPPVHTRQRNIVNRGFTPRRIARLEARIAERVDELFAGFAGRGDVELVRELAAPLPVMVIAELMGLDPARHADFKRWSDDMIVGPTGGAEGGSERREDRLRKSLDELFEHLREVIEQRRKEPAEDLVSALIHAEEESGVLDATQVLHFAQLLIAAGSETTTNLIGNAVLALLAHPEQLAAAQADPSRVPQVIEETLRWDSPVQLVMREATRDVELSGTPISSGTRVITLIGSANRDDAVFPKAAQFDPDRNAQGHMSFGLGNHFCLGSALARLEARIALEAIVTRLPGLALAGDVERQPSFLVRGPRRVPLRFDAG